MIPESASSERKKIIAGFGAELVFSSPYDGAAGAITMAKEIVRKDPGRYFQPDQYNNPSNPRAHELTTGPEIISQAEKRDAQMIEEAKAAAKEESAREKAAAKAEIEQEVQRAKEQLREHVAYVIGPIARPKYLLFTPDLPKTRSGKIMRRLLRSIAKGVELAASLRKAVYVCNASYTEAVTIDGRERSLKTERDVESLVAELDRTATSARVVLERRSRPGGGLDVVVRSA